MKKLLVTTLTESEKDDVRNSGADLLAEYPQAMLVRADDVAEGTIAQKGIEAAPIESEIVPAPAHFAMSSAIAAERMQPVNFPSPNRTAYFLVQLIGPAKPEWTQRV